MNNLTYLSLLLIIILFLSCISKEVKKHDNDKVEDCIERIIAEDQKLGSIRNHECEQISLEETVKNYINALNSLDYSNCPPDFVHAFESHIEAWSNTMPIMSNHNALRGEMHDLFEKIEITSDSAKFTEAINKVWSTWTEVEKTIEQFK